MLLIEVESTRDDTSAPSRRAVQKGTSKSGYDWNDKVIEGFTKGHGGIVEHSNDGKAHRTSVMIPLQDVADM